MALSRWAATMVLAGICVLPERVPAQVEDIDPDAILGVLDLITDPQITADNLGTQLTACLRPLYEGELPHDEIIFELVRPAGR